MKQYARIVGWVFLILGVASAFSEQILGIIQFDMLQNIFRLAIGISAIAISRPNTDFSYAKMFCFLSGPSFLIMGILSFIFPSWGTMHFEAAENLLHLVFGVYSIYLIWKYIRERNLSNDEESASATSATSSSSKHSK